MTNYNKGRVTTTPSIFNTVAANNAEFAGLDKSHGDNSFLFEPTNMGPNTLITVDKNGNKVVYDFDTGKTKTYWKKTKISSKTGTNDFEGSENSKKNDLDRDAKEYKLKNRGNKYEKLDSLWDSIGAIWERYI